MNLEKKLQDLISGMTANPATPSNAVERQAVYLDRSETTDTRWKALVAERLKTAKTFEIHCWNEETEWIQFALQYCLDAIAIPVNEDPSDFQNFIVVGKGKRRYRLLGNECRLEQVRKDFDVLVQRYAGAEYPH